MSVVYRIGRGSFVISCDAVGCESEDEFIGDHQGCVREASAAGWKSKKDGDGWINLCSACALDDDDQVNDEDEPEEQ